MEYFQISSWMGQDNLVRYALQNTHIVLVVTGKPGLAKAYPKPYMAPSLVSCEVVGAFGTIKKFVTYSANHNQYVIIAI